MSAAEARLRTSAGGSIRVRTETETKNIPKKEREDEFGRH